MQLEFSWQILKNTRILNFMKSDNVPCGWMYMDGQTETDRQTHVMKPLDTFAFCICT